MAEYSNDNGGALFKNLKKSTEKHPDYNGSLNVNGVEYWISAWLKEGKSGKFMSLAVNPKEPVARQSSAPTRKGRPDPELEDAPF